MWRLRVRWYMWLAPLLALVVGYATEHGPPAAKSSAASVPGSSLTLEYPAPWRASRLPPALDELGLGQAVVLAPEGDAGSGGLLAVAVPERGAPLPASALSKLLGSVRGEAIPLVGSAGFRYRNLTLAGSEMHLTAYSIPSEGDRFTLAICFAPPGAAPRRGRCEQIIESSKAPAGGPGVLTELRPEPSYAAELSAALQGLQSVQERAQAAISAAPSAGTLTREARHLAAAFATARTEVGKLVPPEVAAHASAALANSMLQAEHAYAALGEAAESGSSVGFRLARSQVEQAEASVRSAQEGLSLLGYRFARSRGRA
jgi:hypothetical protein